MAENGSRRPNEQLRYHRRLRGWTLDDVAERLHGLAGSQGQPELGVDAHMVGRWERGVRRPAPRYVALLCQLFDVRADDLGLIDGTLTQETKEDDLRRRQFLQYLAVVSGATTLDWDRLSTLINGTGPADSYLLDDLRTLTRCYARQVESLAPRSLLPALRSHLAMLTGSLQTFQPDTIRRQLRSLAAETAALAGRLSHLLENRGDAQACWSYAKALATEAQDSSTYAFTLVLQRCQHSSVVYGGQNGDTSRALELLNEADAHLRGTASEHLRACVLASRAEDHAANGNADAARYDLEHASSLLANARTSDDGFFANWDQQRLAGYRGSCALALDQPEEASAILEGTLGRTSSTLIGQRCAVMTDLAAAYARQHEVEHACALLLQSLTVATRAGLSELVLRVHGARRHLEPWSDQAAVRDLDERLLPVG
jgi:transcriptional regulator with XRE-family HTH domain